MTDSNTASKRNPDTIKKKFAFATFVLISARKSRGIFLNRTSTKYTVERVQFTRAYETIKIRWL